MKYKSTKKKKTQRYRQQSTQRKGVLRYVIMAVVVGIFLIFFTGNKSILKLYSLNKEKQRLERQKEQLSKQNEKLREEIQKLKNDEEYMEKVAREKFNMKKEDEDVYIIEPE